MTTKTHPTFVAMPMLAEPARLRPASCWPAAADVVAVPAFEMATTGFGITDAASYVSSKHTGNGLGTNPSHHRSLRSLDPSP